MELGSLILKSLKISGMHIPQSQTTQTPQTTVKPATRIAIIITKNTNALKTGLPGAVTSVEDSIKNNRKLNQTEKYDILNSRFIGSVDFCVIGDEEDQAIELKQYPFVLWEDNAQKHLTENMANEELKGRFMFFRERGRGAHIDGESFHMKLKDGIFYMADDHSTVSRTAFRKQASMENLKFSRCFFPIFSFHFFKP